MTPFFRFSKNAVAAVAVLMLSAPLLTTTAGCGRHKYGADDLQRDLHEYHRNIRWSRPAPVLARVHPDLREAFAKEWDRHAREVQLQEVEVVDVQISEDGDVADVTVMMTWIRLDTQRLEQGSVKEQWRRTDDGWRSMKMFELPKSGGAAQFQSL